MSYQMIHMEVAYRLLEESPLREGRAEFILGSVAPDSVHMAPDYEIASKIRAHLFEGCGEWSETQDYERWNNNILNFWEKQNQKAQTPAEQAFAAGICVHCLTDYANDANIWRRLRGRYIPPMTLEEFRAAFYPEARGIDRWLYQNSSHTQQIRRLLADAQSFSLDGFLDRDCIERQKEHLLYVQYAGAPEDISQYRFLSGEGIWQFIEQTAAEIRVTLRLP